jgi:carbonic anhydrase
MNGLQALKKLRCGNYRYFSEQYAVIDVGQDRRRKLAAGQHPFAAILGCSDSRVPPEIVFDQGLGDLFVVRTAGQVVDKVALGSLEYAVEILGVRLIVVLGHQDCGAVKAAVEGVPLPGQMSAISSAIQPAVIKAHTQEGNVLDNAIIDNIRLSVVKLAATPLLHQALRNKGLIITGALYRITNGLITFF